MKMNKIAPLTFVWSIVGFASYIILNMGISGIAVVTLSIFLLIASFATYTILASKGTSNMDAATVKANKSDPCIEPGSPEYQYIQETISGPDPTKEY